MKIKIEKQNDRLIVEVTPDTSKATLKITLESSQAMLLISLLQTAVKADAFSFAFSGD